MKFSLGKTVMMLLAAVCGQNLHADSLDSIRWRAEVNMDFSDGPYTPFWLSANRQGLSSVKPDNGYVRLGAFKEADAGKRFSWGAGVDLAVPWNYTSSFVIQQLYGELHYRCLDLLVGSKEITGPISDPELSSGNLIHSGNARPIPQIRAGIFDYADIWGTQGWLAVKGYIGYGMFTDSRWKESWVEPGTRYDKGVLYCSRGIWIRNGNPEKFPLTLECGLEMDTEFAGEAFNMSYPGSGIHMRMPHGLKAFIKALIPMHGDSGGDMGEVQNVQGNMLGAWNFALNWEPLDHKWGAKVYYQHMFEDHSMLYIDYPWKDGLYGVEARLPKNRVISKVLYEFMYSKDQSGSVNWTPSAEIPADAPGADNYFNNYIYTGWSHWGMGIGNPLYLSPIYNNPHLLEFLSNRIISHHIGLSGNPIPTLSWRILMSFTSSWGTYVRPYKEVRHMYDGLAEICWRPVGRLRGWEGRVGLAMDRGDMIGHNYGIQLSIAKTGFFKFR